MTPVEVWHRNRQRYLAVLPEIIQTELRDLESAKSVTLLKVEKIEKRRQSAIKRLRKSHTKINLSHSG